jgi:AraC-like DNA-binding protein
MEYIIALGAFQALIALSLFISNRQSKPADSLLNWILICIFSHLSIKFVIYAVSGNVALQNAFNTFIDLAYGPLLWMYTNKVLNDRYRPLQHWFLLTPTLGAGIVYLIITIKIMNNPASATALLALYNNITLYLIIASCTVFPVMCLMLCSKIPAFWKSERQLIQKIAALFLVIPSLWMLTNMFLPMHLIDGRYLNTGIRIFAYSNMLLISLFIIKYRLAANAMKNGAVKEPALPAFPDTPAPAMLVEEKETLVVAVQPVTLPRKSVLTDGQQASIAARLSSLMVEKKAFSDAELTLEKLASLLKIPRHHLSEVLNQFLHKTFYQFINDYRLLEVLHLLDYCKKQGVTPNIMSIAYEAGFNSKSSFNQYFKKATGYTPTEYLKQPEERHAIGIEEALTAIRPGIQSH